MENKDNINLDAVINEVGFEIAKLPDIDKTEINKLLGILATDGIYAMWVYLLSKSASKAGKLLLQIEKFKNYVPELKNHSNDFERVYNALKEIEKLKTSEKNKKSLKNEEEIISIIHNIFTDLSKNFYDLLFFKEILERAMIYARYHAKTMGV